MNLTFFILFDLSSSMPLSPPPPLCLSFLTVSRFLTISEFK